LSWKTASTTTPRISTILPVFDVFFSAMSNPSRRRPVYPASSAKVRSTFAEIR
jgi:hypothetical protein